MGESKHTPGPWQAHVEVDRQTGLGAFAVYTSFGSTDHIRCIPDDSESDANAKVLGAAPEMLEAHRWLMANAAEHSPWLDDHARHCEGCQRYLSAYAKAEGRGAMSAGRLAQAVSASERLQGCRDDEATAARELQRLSRKYGERAAVVATASEWLSAAQVAREKAEAEVAALVKP